LDQKLSLIDINFQVCENCEKSRNLWDRKFYEKSIEFWERNREFQEKNSDFWVKNSDFWVKNKDFWKKNSEYWERDRKILKTRYFWLGLGLGLVVGLIFGVKA
jgi:hypothetical protein